MNIRHTLAALILLVAWPVHANATHPAQDLVVDSTNTVLDLLSENAELIKNDKTFVVKTIEDYIEPHLDLEAMTKLAVGKNWRKAKTDQRTELVAQFRQLLINTYSNALSQYSGQSIDFLPYRKNKREDRAVVRSEFKQTGGAAIPITYKLRDKGGWRIYDIAIDGISLVTNYRTGFSNRINAEGIDGLIAELKSKNAGS